MNMEEKQLDLRKKRKVIKFNLPPEIEDIEITKDIRKKSKYKIIKKKK